MPTQPIKPTRVSLGVSCAVLASLAVVATLDVWVEIFRWASGDSENSHVFLALPVAAWLAFQRRRRLHRWRPEPWVWGLAVVLAGWGLIGLGSVPLGELGMVDAMRHAGAIVTVVGAVLCRTGPALVKRFRPAFVALLFLIPVPGLIRREIAVPLQDASAWVAHEVLTTFGVPVETTGAMLSLNGQDVFVAEACNGMRMVSTLALVAFAFLFSVPMRHRVRLILLLPVPAIALAVNVLRLIPTVLLYGYADLEVADLFHDLSGWAVVLVALAMLSGLIGLLRWLEVPIDPYPVHMAVRGESRGAGRSAGASA